MFLISKDKKEKLRLNLHRSIDAAPFAMFYGNENWSPKQACEMQNYMSNFRCDMQILMKDIVDTIIDDLYTSDDMETDLKLK